jgi:LPS sulfotransferase NodH
LAAESWAVSTVDHANDSPEQALLLLVYSLLEAAQRCFSCANTGGGSSADSERPQPFVIVCSPRSGSTLLVEALDAHPQINCEGEILNALYEVYGDVRMKAWWRVKLHWLAMFTPPLWPQLHRTVCCARASWKGHCAQNSVAVGAKLFHMHAGPGALQCGATVGRLLRALPHPCPIVVLLYRRCMLSSYLSLCRAFETDRWFARVDEQDIDGDASTAQRGAASRLPTAAGLAEYRDAELVDWQNFLASLARSGWRREDLIVLCYEDDIDCPRGWYRARERLVARLLCHSDLGGRDDVQTRAWLGREHVSVVQRTVDPVAHERRAALLAEMSSAAAQGGSVWQPEDFHLHLPAMVETALA